MLLSTSFFEIQRFLKHILFCFFNRKQFDPQSVGGLISRYISPSLLKMSVALLELNIIGINKKSSQKLSRKLKPCLPLVSLSAPQRFNFWLLDPILTPHFPHKNVLRISQLKVKSRLVPPPPLSSSMGRGEHRGKSRSFLRLTRNQRVARSRDWAHTGLVSLNSALLDAVFKFCSQSTNKEISA